MRSSSLQAPFPFVLVVSCAIGLCVSIASAQTVHVDVSVGKTIAFDPDKSMGTSMDILSAKTFNAVYSDASMKAGLSAGWGPITYRQNTELTYDAWHWNPNGTWSDAAHKSGYFVGSAEPKDFLRESYGYRITHRGTTRSDSGQDEYSRMTDGDAASYWKSNPYLTSKFTGTPDATHPQWVVIDFAQPQEIDAIRIAWANPYATSYVVQYWDGRSDALEKATQGEWVEFPQGAVTGGQGGSAMTRLAEKPVATRYLRILMTASSNTCDTHGSEDARNCVGYAINEISAGNFTSQGDFIDLVKHVPGQAQTVTQVSSVDPWHTDDGIVASRIQSGFDLFFTSGYTNHLPALIPVAMFYTNPEDAAAEIAYIEKRGYPIAGVEMSEEPDGNQIMPEDYAEFYLQWATALHKVDPKLKLGGPVFTGENEDIKVWPDAQGRTSWLGRFLDYLKEHGRMSDLNFVSFEHYPLDPCTINWSDLYREPQLWKGTLDAWREDGVPANVPLYNTESNVSWSLTDPMQDVFSGLWLADSVGSFLTQAGPGAEYYQFFVNPDHLEKGCQSWGTFGNFVADEKLDIKGYTSQYFASQLLNLDWVKHGAGMHELHPAAGDLEDEAQHKLITAYAVKRPDGQWSLMLINKDPSNAHDVDIAFEDGGKETAAHFSGRVKVVSFGAAEYVWHSDGAASHADPDGPAARSELEWKKGQKVLLPKASITVVTGKLGGE
jgi:F5/8 type C domain/Glycosyl hydrolases family 39